MRFRFARFTPAEPFVSDLDIGPALEDCLATARHRFPMHNPAPTAPRHPTSLSRVAGPSAGPILCCAAGDIPCGWVRSAPGGGIRRCWGQEFGSRTREMPPSGRKSPRPRRMSPSVAGRRPRCTAGFGGVAGLRLGRAARPGQLAHAGSPRRVAGPAPGRCSPHAWPQRRRRPPVVRRSARSTAPEP